MRKTRQTYDNYFREYNKRPEARKAANKAKKKYKQSLARKYGTTQAKAAARRKEYLKWVRENDVQ